MVTRRPRLDSSAPKELAVSPLPSEETTPPVTKTNFVGWELCRRPCEKDWSRVRDGRSTGDHRNTVDALTRSFGGSAVGHVTLRAGCRGQPHQEGHEECGGGRRDGDAGVVDRRAQGQAQGDGEQPG